MKYYVIAGVVVMAAVVAVMLSRSPAPTSVEVDHYAQKRDIAEVETKVRPARFENMKFQQGVEMRAPASTTK